jgi:hypothetical protein
MVILGIFLSLLVGAAWFREEWTKHVDTKLDMGKSCIRLKNLKKIPYELIAKLAQKMGPEEWISIYEKSQKT